MDVDAPGAEVDWNLGARSLYIETGFTCGCALVVLLEEGPVLFRSCVIGIFWKKALWSLFGCATGAAFSFNFTLSAPLGQGGRYAATPLHPPRTKGLRPLEPAWVRRGRGHGLSLRSSSLSAVGKALLRGCGSRPRSRCSLRGLPARHATACKALATKSLHPVDLGVFIFCMWFSGG